MAAIVVMGVSGCGKSTIGSRLAHALGARFVEGDALHPPANVEKMSNAIPLRDSDRWPWLAKVGQAMAQAELCVASCSALKKSYRKAIIEAAGRPVLFIYLAGSEALLAQRLGQRKGHFMPPSLLASQLATLDVPDSDENALICDAGQTPEMILAEILAQLTNGERRHG